MLRETGTSNPNRNAAHHCWVNPALFFKGDRVAFLREYRLKARATTEREIEDTRLNNIAESRQNYPVLKVSPDDL